MNVNFEIGPQITTVLKYILVLLAILKVIEIIPKIFEIWIDKENNKKKNDTEKSQLIAAKQGYESKKADIQKREEILKELIKIDSDNKDQYIKDLYQLYKDKPDSSPKQ